MNISISCKHAESRAAVETETSRYLEKLGKLLTSYAPDLVQVHGGFEKHPRKIEFTFSLNLSLPTGTLHATGVGSDVRQSIKNAFSELGMQLKKHQSRLRHDYQWKRKRARTEIQPA
jgi:ribosomal subunit interface protein